MICSSCSPLEHSLQGSVLRVTVVLSLALFTFLERLLRSVRYLRTSHSPSAIHYPDAAHPASAVHYPSAAYRASRALKQSFIVLYLFPGQGGVRALGSG